MCRSTPDTAGVPVFVVDEGVAEEQCQRLRAIRARRDGAQVQQALRRLAEVAAGPANLLPPLLETVQAYATIGEICDTLRSIFGVHQEAVVL